MAGLNTGAHGAPNAAPACATTPTLADLALLYGGRDRLLRAAEVAEQLGISTATVYKICKSGELPHIRIIDAIRVRPTDLAAFILECRTSDDGSDGGAERCPGTQSSPRRHSRTLAE
jgi:excisionase family DNA binding protein